MYRPFRWVWIAFGVIIVLIGIGALFSIFYPFATGTYVARPIFFWPFYGIFPLLFVVFVIFFGMRLLFRPWRSRGYYYSGGYDPAMQTLRERYARGEITKEQFEQIARDLQDHRPP